MIDDSRLNVFFDLPKLRHVRLLGDFGTQVESHRRQKPKYEIEVIPFGPESGAEVIQTSAVTIRKYEQDFSRSFRISPI